MRRRASIDPLIDELRMARRLAGLSQGELSAKLGRKTSQTVYQWEGGSDVRLTSLRVWADALGLDIRLVPKEVG